MSTSLEQVLDRAFGHPRGVLGRVGGWLMATGNAATERHVVGVARLTEGETVLVIGPGPGVGVLAAAAKARRVIGVDPSAEMLELCAERCEGTANVELHLGSAAETGLEDASADVVISVNNVQLWPDRAAGFAEVRRVLRPGGKLVLSAHEKWLPVSRHELAAEVTAAGFTDLQTWVWEPPGPLAARAAQLRAIRVD
ncbi:class I SAM-dependent methyltransferase [Amycolatopsis magusensis]|uniref:Ubiquinone/menaquinone biosynthesis C-methylase UbiE n=1 Tax=Amycolatopsis magusensis TaxID=882444 RepID=A0ABS4PQ31_9PSEU|nr:class I SAM-dependent methyltransferase [Amycolatopsis magusensis]MBP2181515.1 ubiquinone/menaquinone biosynthesis C-methylase UbiE [Amycolatopsis magusensis]MDI5978025.1 class I SAM-dependent methyltransferase [Amycolatopsis magusensis]